MSAWFLLWTGGLMYLLIGEVLGVLSVDMAISSLLIAVDLWVGCHLLT